MCKCNQKTTPCQQCQNDTCGCLEKYSGECIQYEGNNLTNLSIDQGLNFNKVVEEIDGHFSLFKMELDEFISIQNVGNGSKIYRGDDLQGRKELRTLTSLIPEFSITEESDDIRFSITSATNNQKGIIQLATQSEVEIGNDNTKAITPSLLNTFVSDSSNFPQSGEGTAGIVEIGSQTDVDNGTSNTVAVTPQTLANYVENQINNIAPASETEEGVIEIATQAETNLGTDDIRAITPLKLNNFVTSAIAAISTLDNLPNATETVKGIAEIATQAEVNLGQDDERFVTPKKLKDALEDLLNSVNIKPVQNRGTISSIDVGAGTVNSSYTVSGDITSAIIEQVGGGQTQIRVTMANPMQNNSYVVKMFKESLGNINFDDNPRAPAFQTINTTTFRVSLSDELAGLQSIRLHLEVEQR